MTGQVDLAGPELRVAQIIGRLSIGGAERHFVSLCNSLPGCEVVAIFVSEQLDGPSLRAELAHTVRQVEIPVRRRSIISGVRRLADELNASRCEVVHTHMFWPTLYGCLAARLAGIPVVITTEHGENRWKRSWHRWLERNVISRIAKLRFCVSPAILQRRRDDDGVPETLLRLIANGTAIPVIDGVRNMAEPPLIGSVGRLVSQKNFCLLVDAVAEIRRQGKDVRACIVGDGPERSKIAERIDAQGIRDVFQLPGFDTDTDGWYRKFDVYVNSSTEEGQPISVLEAMAYALPIVACDVGAMRDMILTEREGLIVPPSNVDAMTAALSRLLSDRAFAGKLGNAARERATAQFSIEAVAAQYCAHYRRLAAGIDGVPA